MTLAEVLAALRSGRTFQTGGGRYYFTFKIVDGVLTRTMFDEGLVVDEVITEADLAKALTEYPGTFAA